MSSKERKRIPFNDAELGGVENKGFEREPEYLPTSERNGRNSLTSKRSSINSDAGEAIDRENWDSPIEFLLSCISMSVGLGNIWRFPYTAYANGGGAFLIPYIIVLIFIGRPIYFLEMALGQFSSFGSVKAWACTPAFKGLGYIGVLAGFITLSYYCSIIATTIYYFAVSFQAVLPWTVCDPAWGNATCDCADGLCPQYYFEKTVTEQIWSIDNGIGLPLWELTLCLAGAWLFIFFSLVKGVQSSGKVAYFTALFPYVVLFIFLIRGVTLPGSDVGILYFITPQWEKVLDPTVWYAAVGQCFFSLGTGTGPITMFASYNPFRHTAYRDALIISLMDTFTSLLAGMTIFSVLGHLAWARGVEVPDVAAEGPGLIFVSYPSAIALFPGYSAQVFSVLFFLMLFTLGIGSANALAGTPITILSDQFPHIKKWLITLVCCIIGFLSGLIYCTPGGQFMVTFMDYYGVTNLLYFVCMMEAVAIAWSYGVYKFIRDIEFMLGIKVGWYWILCWGGVIPVGLGAVLVYAYATAKVLTHAGYEFPEYMHYIGWGILGFALCILPGVGLYTASKTSGATFGRKIKNSFAPSKTWGPRAPHFRKGWEMFKKHGETKLHFEVSDTQNIKLYIRGVKERILVTPEKNSVTIRLYGLRSDAEVNHRTSSAGVKGHLMRLLGNNRHTWIVMEKKFEAFRVSTLAGTSTIKEVNAQKMYNNDYVITIKF